MRRRRSGTATDMTGVTRQLPGSRFHPPRWRTLTAGASVLLAPVLVAGRTAADGATRERLWQRPVSNPALLGNLRLADPSHREPTPSAAGEADRIRAGISVVLPAHDEEATVRGVVERVPSTVCGVPVEVTVVDDGSGDRTAERARSAGARVVSFPRNRGLGAAVRFGLSDAASRGAAAVAFLDADGEYDPEELEVLVAPILRGDADYVIGSRFAGRIERMHPHRRVGNRLLSFALSVVARRRIGDGQSGFRALSGPAAADAEIIHDFNYAQVLTLDLLAKGYRYLEVPISYRFRTAGRSFVRPASYLRRVLPAIYREINAPPALATPGP